MKNKKKIYTTISLIMICLAQKLYSQGCSMCKAVAESNIDSGFTEGSGLNAGILYIMIFPYILISIFVFFWYKHQKKIRKN